jgi:hypothetical protein
VQLLVRPPRPTDTPELQQARRATLDFVKRFDITELTPETAEAVLSHICYPLVPRPELLEAFKDYLQRGVESFIDFIHTLPALDNWVRGCPQADIPAAVHWMYVRVAQDTAPNGPSLSEDQAQKFAEHRMGMDYDDYWRAAQDWASVNSWILVRGWHKLGPVGMSIVLPVKPTVYQDVLDGHKAPYDCTSADLLVPSRHLLVEAVAERPEYVGRPHINPTKALRASSIFQVAALSRCNRLDEPSTLRILSFAGTPLNEVRLRKSGFVSTGRLMRYRNPTVKLKLYEQTIPIGQVPMKDFFSSAALELLGARCPSSPCMDND